jgi:peptidoglycan/LPS O-acetylase OafA/YrhL
LIANSVVRAKTAKKYFKARILRIFPALFFVIFLLTFVIGPIITRLSVLSYFSNTVTYRYLLNSMLVIQHNLPGVFQNTIYGPTVNGPLWTLPVEFGCYILCFIAYKMGFINKKKFFISIPLFLLACAGILFIEKFSITIITELRPVVFFYIGMGMYIYTRIKYSSIVLSLF